MNFRSDKLPYTTELESSEGYDACRYEADDWMMLEGTVFLSVPSSSMRASSHEGTYTRSHELWMWISRFFGEFTTWLLNGVRGLVVARRLGDN